MQPTTTLLRYSELDYASSEILQQGWVDQRKRDLTPDLLVLLEHRPVLTLGRSAELTLRVPESELAVPLVRTVRGGKITYHGPGQLVAYPILKLEGQRRDLHLYLRSLEEVAIAVAGDFGVTAERSPGRTGVWVGPRKLASIGIRASQWVTSHGVALNYGLDLGGFDLIEPCGLTGVRMTSLGVEIGQAPVRAELEASFVRQFSRVFETLVADARDPLGDPGSDSA